MSQHKLIIDTDPGVDDAIAILFAINHPDIELLGLTTVFGNLATTGSTQNALDLLHFFEEAHIPVAKGADQPLLKKLDSFADFVHGANGLGNIEIPSTEKEKHHLNGPEFIIEQVLKYPNEVTICGIAPLTNLALALAIEPKIAELTKQVIIMGGAVNVNGNVSPVAEANIHNDPHAADKVLTAPWPVTLVGLDVTMQVILDEQFMENIKNKSHKGELLYQISRFYDDFYRGAAGLDGFACHDATAVAYLTNPELFHCVKGSVRVGTEGLCEGMTIVDTKMNYGNNVNAWTNMPKVNICLDVDQDGMKALLDKYLY